MKKIAIFYIIMISLLPIYGETINNAKKTENFSLDPNSTESDYIDDFIIENSFSDNSIGPIKKQKSSSKSKTKHLTDTTLILIDIGGSYRKTPLQYGFFENNRLEESTASCIDVGLLFYKKGFITDLNFGIPIDLSEDTEKTEDDPSFVGNGFFTLTFSYPVFTIRQETSELGFGLNVDANIVNINNTYELANDESYTELFITSTYGVGASIYWINQISRTTYVIWGINGSYDFYSLTRNSYSFTDEYSNLLKSDTSYLSGACSAYSVNPYLAVRFY